MKLISWNVNGLRACLNKGFKEFFDAIDADVFCIQETKMQPEQMVASIEGYYQYWNSAVKKGYSGTAVFTKELPVKVTYDIGVEAHTGEGRVITVEYDKFFLVNCYTPNAQEGLARIDYRMRWEDDFRAYLKELDGTKPVVVCGDLNVARTDQDVHPKERKPDAIGQRPDERERFERLLAQGLVDLGRTLDPANDAMYTWWPPWRHMRQRNIGWRLDYVLASAGLARRAAECQVQREVGTSDHAPVAVTFADT
jgi:exodeoxyribonuclease III